MVQRGIDHPGRLTLFPPGVVWAVVVGFKIVGPQRVVPGAPRHEHLIIVVHKKSPPHERRAQNDRKKKHPQQRRSYFHW